MFVQLLHRLMDQHYLLHALTLAASRRGFCAPNPAVGAVIVKDNQVIASGCHYQAGSAHAEIAALQQLAPNETNGTTLYVTLEPCCHWGKTPPCSDAIIKAGIARVVYAFADPNPQVAGKGAKQLIDAGLICEQLPIPEITTFYRSYQYWTETKRPWITAKLALSLDGKIAGPHGASLQITGKDLQNVTHQLRLASDAILTTARSTINDDPQLNCRDDEKIIATKPVYIIDRLLSITPDKRIFKTAASVTLFHSEAADADKIAQWQQRGIRCIAVTENNHLLDLEKIIFFIGADGVHDLLVEAGGHLFENLLSQGLMNQAKLYLSAKILGATAWPAFKNEHLFATLAKKIKWSVIADEVICDIELVTARTLHEALIYAYFPLV